MFEQGLLAQVSFLRSEHFYADANRRVYEAIQALDAAGQPLTVVMVSGWLRDRDLLAKIGGTPYLVQMLDTTPAAVHVEAHARRIVNTYELRQIIFTCQRIASESMGDIGDLDSWKQAVDARIAAVTGSESQQKNLVLMDDATREALRVLHERQNSQHKVPGFTTGLPTLDQRLGGFERTKKYVVAARPGMGKSAAMATFVLAAAREVRDGAHTCGVVCVSVEMPCIEITNRLLSQLSRVDSVKIQRGRLDVEELKRVHEAAQILARLPIAIEDSSNHTPASIRSAYRNGKRKLFEKFAPAGSSKQQSVAAGEAGMPFYGALAEVGLLAIDYLQLLGTEDKPTNREAEVSAVCRATKAIAKSENIAVLELAQVNRDCEKRPGNDKRPQLADLRESGAIEQDANCVMFLYRDDVYKKDGEEKDDKAEIIVRKLRDNGGPGTVHCEFHPSTMTFYEKSRDPDYSQLGDMFDPYVDGSYGETGGSNLREWTPYDDDN